MLLENTDLIVELDSTLTKKDLTPTTPEEKTRFSNYFTSKDKVVVRDAINGSHLHRNYLTYLEIAWANHYGVVLSPDIFWHLTLSEIGSHIKEYNQHIFYLLLYL